MVTAIEGGCEDESMSTCTDSVYMDATPSNVPAEAETSGHEGTPEKEKKTTNGEEEGTAVTPTQTTVDNNQMEGSALWKETQDKLQKQLNSFTPVSSFFEINYKISKRNIYILVNSIL